MALTFFFPVFHFDPPENIRKPKFFYCFQGESKGSIGKKRVNLVVPLEGGELFVKLNPFHVNIPFIYPLKAENHRFKKWNIGVKEGKQVNLYSVRNF